MISDCFYFAVFRFVVKTRNTYLFTDLEIATSTCTLVPLYIITSTATPAVTMTTHNSSHYSPAKIWYRSASIDER